MLTDNALPASDILYAASYCKPKRFDDAQRRDGALWASTKALADAAFTELI